jgi:hypothetical protein
MHNVYTCTLLSTGKGFIDRGCKVCQIRSSSVAPSLSSAQTGCGIGSISDHASEDMNKDDAGDDNLEGVLVMLKDRKGTVIAPLSTNSMGTLGGA